MHCVQPTQVRDARLVADDERERLIGDAHDYDYEHEHGNEHEHEDRTSAFVPRETVRAKKTQELTERCWPVPSDPVVRTQHVLRGAQHIAHFPRDLTQSGSQQRLIRGAHTHIVSA